MMYWVRVVNTDDYCLMWGDGSPRWEGTKANAIERAKSLTATNRSGQVFEIIPVTPEGK